MFKILSINVRGLGEPPKKSSLFQQFETFGSDVILLQETMANRKSLISSLENLWPGRSFLSAGLDRQGGWLSFSRKNAMQQ